MILIAHMPDKVFDLFYLLDISTKNNEKSEKIEKLHYL